MKCIGFGDKTGKCNNTAGTKWSRYWCAECDQKRLEHIDKQLQKMSEALKTRE